MYQNRRSDRFCTDRRREYRGFVTEYGRWVYGGFHVWQKRMLSPVGNDTLRDDDISYIIIQNSSADWNMPREMQAVEVIPESVGEFSGYYSEAGGYPVAIYEGDIVEFDDCGEDGYEYREGFDFVNRAVVVFNNGRFELGNFLSDNSGVLDDMNSNDHEDFTIVFKHCKVVGNIYQNPELLDPPDDPWDISEEDAIALLESSRNSEDEFGDE